MGIMRFDIYPPDRISPKMASLAYMTGMDNAPWRRIAAFKNGRLELVRTSNDSGNVHVLWPVEGHGQMMVSTAWLMERERPYHLPLELARGKLSQLRLQAAVWESIGLAIPPSIKTGAEEAMQKLRDAIVRYRTDPLEAAADAESALKIAMTMGDQLASKYAEGTLLAHRRMGSKRDCLVGVHLGPTMVDDFTSRHVSNTFNAVIVPLVWREIEANENRRDWEVFDSQIAWAKANGLTICAGPLLSLDSSNTPDWLCLFENDFEAIRAAVGQFVEAAVQRYRGQVDIWLGSQRTNLLQESAVGKVEEDELVQLTAQVIEQVKSLDPNTPRIVSFDRPWAEYVAESRVDFPPWFFADALIRGNLGLSGVMLEINFGYASMGTLPRDLLEISHLLDVWGMLGVPVFLNLAVPSAAHADPLARFKTEVLVSDCSPLTQESWCSRYLPLMLAKPCVRGIFWSQLHDMLPHDYPYAGLFDPRRKPKPILKTIETFRNVLLPPVS